jgi:hypothetical protein
MIEHARRPSEAYVNLHANVEAKYVHFNRNTSHIILNFMTNIYQESRTLCGDFREQDSWLMLTTSAAKKVSTTIVLSSARALLSHRTLPAMRISRGTKS